MKAWLAQLYGSGLLFLICGIPASVVLGFLFYLDGEATLEQAIRISAAFVVACLVFGACFILIGRYAHGSQKH